MTIKFRFHRGSLDDSLETVIAVNSKQELLDILNKSYANWYDGKIIYKLNNLHIEPYGYDERIKWHTFIVTLDPVSIYYPDARESLTIEGHVVGFMSGALE